MRTLIFFILIGLGSQAYAQSLKYGFFSAVIPGAGQFANPQQPKSKGFLFLLLTFGGAGGTYYLETQRSESVRLANQATNLSIRQKHIENADYWQTMRNIAGLGTAAFWLWNVVDAMAYSGGGGYSYRKPKTKKLQLFTRSTYGYDEIGLRLYLN